METPFHYETLGSSSQRKRLPEDQGGRMAITSNRAGVPSDATNLKRLAASKSAIAAVKKQHPGLRVEQFGSVSTKKELNHIFQSDLAKAETISLPITLLILMIAFGSLIAAGVPLLLAISCVAAAMA